MLGAYALILWNGLKTCRQDTKVYSRLTPSPAHTGRGHTPRPDANHSYDANFSEYISRSLYFCTLPLAVIGKALTNSQYFGIL